MTIKQFVENLGDDYKNVIYKFHMGDCIIVDNTEYQHKNGTVYEFTVKEYQSGNKIRLYPKGHSNSKIPYLKTA